MLAWLRRLGPPFGNSEAWITVGSAAGILILVFALSAADQLPEISGSSGERYPVTPAPQSPDESGPTPEDEGGPVVASGLLEGRPGLVSSDVDLSVEGKLDWAHWGYRESDDTHPDKEFLGNPALVDCQPASRCVNRKQGGSPRIGDFTPVGDVDPTSPFRLYRRDGTRFSWGNGSPVPSVADARTVFYVPGAGNGYRIQVSADQTVHRFTLYIDIWQAKVQCVASISDRSAPVYTDDSLTPRYAPINSSYTFTYRAARPGQTLTVTLTIVEDWGGANTALSAAALS